MIPNSFNGTCDNCLLRNICSINRSMVTAFVILFIYKSQISKCLEKIICK